ncbi:hypothetical protein SCARR_02391 [Pontiella sulfatireligans]|uniref:Uncharacterized protein n=1 Tax=Pontiella sulfatireligans TaxID=2750658 RepID=A0A6C2UK40_9BACT|nr:hypothetical protein SCARR_02391 [Pontiella sulfatireligans]
MKKNIAPFAFIAIGFTEPVEVTFCRGIVV